MGEKEQSEEHKSDQENSGIVNTIIPIENIEKKFQKIINKPVKKRDKNVSENDSEKSESESSSDDDTDKIVNAVKADEKVKAIRAEKPNKRVYKTLRKEEVSDQVEFSIFGVEAYIESNMAGSWYYISFGVYVLCGIALFLLPPSLVLMVEKQKVPRIFVSVSKQPAISVYQANFKMSVYLACMFTTYIAMRMLFEQIVYVTITVLKFLKIKITKETKTMLFIVNEIKYLICAFLFFVFSIVECNILLEEYSVFQVLTNNYQRVGAYSLCCVILLGMFIAEKTFLKSTVAIFGNNVFSTRIGDVNLKQSIVRRMFMYSGAITTGNMQQLNHELSTGIELTDSFLCSHSDFKIRSLQNCEEIVGTIYSRLDIQALTYAHICSAFGAQGGDIWKYMITHTADKKDGKELKEITYEDFYKFTKTLYTEKTDLKRTLYDRDKLLGKLDTILGCLALLLTVMISTPVIGFDPIKYMAGLIPLIMSSGWLFSDIIKEVFKNFIFLLHEHPFDVGDRVIVKDKEMTVVRIDLMYTTFTSKGGTICYIPNSRMIEERIYNIRRSDVQTEMIHMVVNDLMKIDDIEQVKTDTVNLVTKEKLEEKICIIVHDYEIHEKHTTIIFRVQYLSNCQSEEPSFVRRNRPTQIIQQAIKDRGYKYIDQTNSYSL